MTERELHEQASALFLELRDLSEAGRRPALDTAPEAVRREVESLLSHDLGGGPDGRTAPLSPQSAGLPGWIGPYRVIERLGRGGSGVVLLAEQREPVRRKVAIKVVPHAAISPDLAARFEFERRALERAQHPNIAHILDAGRTPDGLPYLVMDYVEGAPITEYAARRGLGLRDRIGLMLQVADAVQHAHQRGVIHRDLKPGNILVTEVSGRPGVRVLDFGIARPIPEAFDVTAPPTSGQLLGTPAYMAPEQTGGSPIDTRADVYAIGAVLYELTCGRPPVDARGDAMEVLRRIRDAVPMPASRLRAREPGLSADAVPGAMLADLDCILGRALEKDPARRYPTVAALADDLRRLLGREPITARPPTIRYRAARFAQRNRVLVASLTVVGLAVVVGVAGLGWGLLEARRQRAEAASQSEAQREINRFLTDDLLAAASPEQQGEKVTALDLLHRASRRVDQRLGDRPLVAAAVHHALGTAFMELGAFEDAQRHIERAVALRRDHAGGDAPDTVRSEIAAGALLGRRQKFPEAEAALTRAVERARRLLGPGDPALYAALNDLGSTREGLDKGQEAVAALSEALEGRRRLLGPSDSQVLVTISNLASACDRVGESGRALELNLEALGLADGLEEPPRMTLIGLCNNIGATYQDANRDAEAAPYLRRAAELAREWLGAEHPDALTIRANLASLEAELGDPQRGAELYDEVLRARMRLLGPDAFDTLTSRYGYWNCLWIAERFDEAARGYAGLLPDMVRALGDDHWLAVQTRAALALALADAGRPAEALPYAERATAQFRALYGADHGRTRNAAATLARVRSSAAVLGAPAPER